MVAIRDPHSMILNRRLVLTAMCLPLVPGRLRAAELSGRVTAVSGGGEAQLPDGSTVALKAGLHLPPGVRFRTGTAGLIEVALNDGSRLNAGGRTTVALEQGSAAGTTMNVSGVAVLDRRGVAEAGRIVVQSDDFEITMADARVFLDSVEDMAVYVNAGDAEIAVGPAVFRLTAGDGVDLADALMPMAPAPPPPPAPPAARPPTVGVAPAPPPVPPRHIRRWSKARVDRAFARVGLTA